MREKIKIIESNQQFESKHSGTSKMMPPPLNFDQTKKPKESRLEKLKNFQIAVNIKQKEVVQIKKRLEQAEFIEEALSNMSKSGVRKDHLSYLVEWFVECSEEDKKEYLNNPQLLEEKVKEYYKDLVENGFNPKKINPAKEKEQHIKDKKLDALDKTRYLTAFIINLNPIVRKVIFALKLTAKGNTLLIKKKMHELKEELQKLNKEISEFRDKKPKMKTERTKPQNNSGFGGFGGGGSYGGGAGGSW